MEYRKIQKTGNSSFIVSLPKEWVTANNIHEQDKVGMITRQDNILLIIPKVANDYIQKEKSINVDHITNEDFFYRLLLGAYIMGYNIIKVTCSERLDIGLKNVARKFIRDVIGLEIMEETQHSLVIKDLLNSTEMKFNSWIDRISQLVITQYEDAMLAIEKRDEKLSKEIIARDAEVNRIHWLILRQHNILQRNLLLSEQLGSGEKRDANFTLISRVIERIGDHAVRIAKNNWTLLEKELNPKIVENIGKAGKISMKIFRESINAFNNEDIYAANANIDFSNKNLVIICESIEHDALDMETKQGITLGYIAESIRRAGEYSIDLAEYIINYLTDKSKF
nr:PhoU domain-containing protein [Candidatus Sigynarchaeota archaeon]